MLDPEDMAQLKEIFVTRRECNETTEGMNEKISSENAKLAAIEQQIKTVTWLNKTELGVLITGIGGALLALLLK